MTSLICGISSKKLKEKDIEMLKHPLVCGVILFKRNFQDYFQLKNLIADIKNKLGKDFIISVDQEGGRVRRFDLPFTRLPPLEKIGENYDINPDFCKSYAHVHAWLMASELLSVDVDMSFAPVLDIDNGSEVIGDRAFSSNPKVVTELSKYYCTAMQEAGMKTTVKHFPGHGTVTADSHFELPIDSRSYDEINSLDLLPFRTMIQSNKVDAVMMSHVIYDQCCESPAGYSRYWCQKILRDKFQFEGIIISDDLGMKAADCVGDVHDRYHACVDAGIDIALACTAELSEELLSKLPNNQPRKRFPQLIGKSKLSTQEPFWQNNNWQSLRKALIKLEMEPSE